MARHCQTPQYACSFAMSLADMTARCAELEAQQYRPLQIVSSADGAAVSYAAIWTRDLRSSLMRIESNLLASDYQEAFDELNRDGYRLLSISGAAGDDRSRYTSLWEDGGWTGFVSRAGLSVAEYQAEFDRQQASGYSLIWVNGHATPSGSSYAGIWSRFANPDRRSRHNLPIDDYQEVFDDYAADGYRIAHFNAHRVGSQTYVAAIWIKENGYNPSARHNMTDCQLQNELERRAFEDSRPICISGYATAAGTRYGAIWVANSRSLITQGRAGAGLDAIDDSVRSLMESSRITAASVAVARNGALVLARGFCDVTDEEEPVSPTAIFRVASVSKALTGTAIVKLIEDGKLEFDDRLLDLLGTPDDVLDNRLRDVTVDHLLHHRGGWHVEPDTQPDPMFSDQTIAANLGLSLPITQESIFRWTSSQRRLDYTPGLTYDYSNYGYMLLGMIVERMTGQRYEDYVSQNLLAPLGIRRMRCAKTLLPDRLPGEVVYHHRHSRRYPNVMEAGAPVDVLQMYGSLNFVNLAAHGGWVASAVDLVKFASAFDDPARCPILSPSSVNTLFNRLQPATAKYSYGCGWEVEPGTVTKMYKTGGFNGTSALIYRQSDGVDVAVILNRMSGETFDPACDGDSTTPPPASVPTWDLVQLVAGWIRGVKTWPSVDMFSEFF